MEPTHVIVLDGEHYSIRKIEDLEHLKDSARSGDIIAYVTRFEKVRAKVEFVPLDTAELDGYESTPYNPDDSVEEF